MKAEGAIRFAAAAAATLALGGCYTVVLAPYSASAPVAETAQTQEYAAPDGGAEARYLSPRSGRFSDRDGYDDYWGYSDPYAYPTYYYDSGFGASLYGGGYSPYYGYGSYWAGYGPYGYGYDPYYRAAGGLYVPPGYELVTTTELRQLLDDSRVLRTNPAPASTPADLEQERQQRQGQAQQAWSRRTDYRERKEPEPTVRAATSTSTSSSTTGTSASSGSSTSSTPKPAATQSSGADNAKERKTRR
ncbi:MAG: hypothetical protein ABIL09_26870 [Gemmatimonadota bacterium]